MANVAQPTGWGSFDGPQYQSWIPHDTFSWLRDGQSNQIIFGEKHIPIFRIDVYEGPNGSSGIFGAVWDCGILMPADNWREIHCARGQTNRYNVNDPLVPETIVGSANKYADTNPDSYAFGSAHTGICNFLIGDGSVRGLSSSTLPLLVCRLVDTKDANAVSLP